MKGLKGEEASIVADLKMNLRQAIQSDSAEVFSMFLIGEVIC